MNQDEVKNLAEGLVKAFTELHDNRMGRRIFYNGSLEYLVEATEEQWKHAVSLAENYRTAVAKFYRLSFDEKIAVREVMEAELGFELENGVNGRFSLSEVEN